uniref:Uncharacterized protein n=1 Tax=Romanomermis culicivorax TaxID=13658 RepID=A0A915L2K7_ROMCU
MFVKLKQEKPKFTFVQDRGIILKNLELQCVPGTLCLYFQVVSQSIKPNSEVKSATVGDFNESICKIGDGGQFLRINRRQSPIFRNDEWVIR